MELRSAATRYEHVQRDRVEVLTPMWSITTTASWSQTSSWVYSAFAMACESVFAASETAGDERALELGEVNSEGGAERRRWLTGWTTRQERGVCWSMPTPLQEGGRKGG